MTRRRGEAAPDTTAIVQETEGAMSEQQQQQKQPEQTPNIRLREKMEPVTEGDLGYRGIKLPSADEQKGGWYEPKASLVLALYGTHYEPLDSQG
jgi:hypothetical protein